MTVKSIRAFLAVSRSQALGLALLALVLAPGAHAGRAYVSNEDDGTVTVLDTERLTAIAAVPAGRRRADWPSVTMAHGCTSRSVGCRNVRRR
jgi:YVTN family beta-propeller protein